MNSLVTSCCCFRYNRTAVIRPTHYWDRLQMNEVQHAVPGCPPQGVGSPEPRGGRELPQRGRGKGGRGGAPSGRVPTGTEGNIERANETVVRAWRKDA